MLRKQNCDPNRSTRVISSNNLIDKKLHNSSLNTISSTQNTISSTQQCYPLNQKRDNNQEKQQRNKIKQNKNSRILAKIKQSKQGIMSKRQGTKSTNISTTRNNYKPKFILKQLINSNINQNNYQQEQTQQQQLIDQYSHQKQQYSHQRQSMCENYYLDKHQYQQKQNHNMSNTFNNSPLASQSCYKVTQRNKKLSQQDKHIILLEQQKNKKRPTFIYQHLVNSKSVILSKRTLLQNQDKTSRNTYKQQIEQDNLKNLNKPLQLNKINKQNRKSNKTQQSLQQQYPSSVQQYEVYEQASTVEYPRKLFNKKGREEQEQSQNQGYEFESRIRSISSSNPCRQQNQIRSMSINNNNNQHINYKTAYLQTKKQLQIRSAYFNEAIQLCKHIIGNMKVVMEEEYVETQSDRVMWCHQRCQDILNAFQDWTE